MRNFIMISGLLLGSPAIAATASEHLDSLDKLKSDAGVNLENTERKCLDFSGEWAGRCDIKIEHGDELFNVTKDVSFTLSQKECGEISMNGGKYKSIGVAVNKSFASEVGFRHQNNAYYWMDNETLAYSNQIEGMKYDKDAKHRTLKESKRLRFLNDNTVSITKKIKTKASGDRGQQDIVKYSYSCTVQR